MSDVSAREKFNQLVFFANEIKRDNFSLTNDQEYAEVLQSIQDHKYLTNEQIPREITMDEALFSWYENVYHPLTRAIDSEGLICAFPKATRGEVFLWVTRHWHFLKEELKREVSAEEAVYSYGKKFGKTWISRTIFSFKMLMVKH